MPFEDNSKISEVPQGLRSEMFRPESHEESWILQNETGADRLKMMFDISCGFGPELTLVRAGFTIGGLTGLLVGGLNYAKLAKMNYIRKNQATPFINPKQAAREMHDTMFLEFARGGFKLGWRMAVFSTLYMTGVTAGFTYRNKFGIAEHAAAGGEIAREELREEGAGHNLRKSLKQVDFWKVPALASTILIYMLYTNIALKNGL